MIIQIDANCPVVRAIRLAIALGGEFSPPGHITVPGETRMDDCMNKCRELGLFLELRDSFSDFILKSSASYPRDIFPRQGGSAPLPGGVDTAWTSVSPGGTT